MAGIFDVFSNQDAQNAANAQIGGINTGYANLTDLANRGRGALTTNYAAALAPFTQNYATGVQGSGALSDALGLNGPAGNTRATTAFWNNPAIQSQLDVGTQNVLRNATATGQLASGKTNVDLQNYGQGVASQGWNSYIRNLMPFLNYGQAAASGIANVDTGLGSALNQSFTNQGNAAYGAATSAGNAQANADLANYNASANIWGALGNLAKLGVSGGGTVGGNLLSSGAGGIGSALSYLPAIFSDERLKEDIEPVGELYDGTGVFRYRYIGDPTPRIGVMAQEVERTRPDAVVEIGGFKAVDYGKATDYAAALARFAEEA